MSWFIFKDSRHDDYADLEIFFIAGLDPAKPMFENNNADRRIDRSHAKNVQIVHTCAGLLGISSALGTSDFYANGGKIQPGCKNDLLGKNQLYLAIAVC